MRVLVVEDDQNLGETFGDALLEFGHQPTVVGTAEAALERLRTGPSPDAMILDIQLPGMSGLDLLKLHPVRDSGVPVVVISGVITEAQARDCLRLGAVDFLRKPVSLDYLAKVLTSIDLHGAVEGGRRWAERRRSPRAHVAVPVRLLHYNGSEVQGTSVDLSVTGMKVRSTATLSRDAAVILSFTLPDSPAPMSVPSMVARVDGDGYGFTFVNLLDGDSRQIDHFTRASVAA
jgi:DNA-binding response OmpR family regulator